MCFLGWVIVLGMSGLALGGLIFIVGIINTLIILGMLTCVVFFVTLFSWGCVLIQENCGK
jgi:hypothetical protein